MKSGGRKGMEADVSGGSTPGRRGRAGADRGGAADSDTWNLAERRGLQSQQRGDDGSERAARATKGKAAAIVGWNLAAESRGPGHTQSADSTHPPPANGVAAACGP